MTSIQGKVAVVTGAGRGIGRAIAVELGGMGARVAVAARNVDELEETARIIGTASVVRTDVRKRDDIHNLLDQAASTLGPVDILVNAAGLGIFGPVADFNDEDYDTLLETNLKSIFYSCRYVLPSMMARKTGNIINIASIAGKVGSATRAVYCASKFGVVGFTRALAAELAGRVGVTLLIPGGMRTAFFDGRAEQYRPGPDADLSDPDDVAQVVLDVLRQPVGCEVRELVVASSTEPSWP